MRVTSTMLSLHSSLSFPSLPVELNQLQSESSALITRSQSHFNASSSSSSSSFTQLDNHHRSSLHHPSTRSLSASSSSYSSISSASITSTCSNLPVEFLSSLRNHRFGDNSNWAFSSSIDSRTFAACAPSSRRHHHHPYHQTQYAHTHHHHQQQQHCSISNLTSLKKLVKQTHCSRLIRSQSAILSTAGGPVCTLRQLLRKHTLSKLDSLHLLRQLLDAVAFFHTERPLPLPLPPQTGCFVLRNLRTDHIALDSFGQLRLTHLKHVLWCPSNGPTGRPLLPTRAFTRQPLQCNSDDALRSLLADEALSITRLEYCAPELLRRQPLPVGALDARLRQLDVYALAVCIWELTIRCRHLYQDDQIVSSYSRPLTQELKCAQLRRTRSKMQLLVDAHQTRPWFPDTWKRDDALVR